MTYRDLKQKNSEIGPESSQDEEENVLHYWCSHSSANRTKKQ